MALMMKIIVSWFIWVRKLLCFRACYDSRVYDFSMKVKIIFDIVIE